jgi:hypothetical protein
MIMVITILRGNLHATGYIFDRFLISNFLFYSVWYRVLIDDHLIKFVIFDVDDPSILCRYARFLAVRGG